MAEEREDKGFKVIDRRGVEPPSPPPGEKTPPEAEAGRERTPRGDDRGAPETAGNRPGAGGVEGEKGRAGRGPSALRVPRFLDLVQSLQVGAMAGLGMIQGPGGKRPPVDLPAAKDAIDLLGILQEKTKGNLTKEEEEVLREGLYHLRMGYMALLNAPPGGPEKGGNRR
ncbi:MAG: hypothetical protein OHK0028_02010 [Deltaproteobacteria bacterium]